MLMKIYTATISSYNKNDIHGKDRPFIILELENGEILSYPERTIHDNPNDKNYNPKHLNIDNSKLKYFRFSPGINGISHYVLLTDLKFITKNEILRIFDNKKFILQNNEFIDNFFETKSNFMSIKNKTLY